MSHRQIASAPGPGGPKRKASVDAGGGDDDGQGIRKPVSRVNRACDACRKQKMRCQGAENPPCQRCRTSGIPCTFEKPARESSAMGEAGMERIRNLETQVSSIQSSLSELVGILKTSPALSLSSPVSVSAPAPPPPPPPAPPFPSFPSAHPTPAHEAAAILMGAASPSHFVSSHTHQAHPQSALDPALHNARASPAPAPPLPSLHSVLPPHHPHASSPSPVAPFPRRQPPPPPPARPYSAHAHPQPHRNFHSAVTSAASSDTEDELPSAALIAPIEVLRGLADAAAERAAAEAATRPPSPAVPVSSEQQMQAAEDAMAGVRASKRRKTEPPKHMFEDVVTKGVVSDAEARELYNIFFSGCHKFLAVLDLSFDTYDSLRVRSPFCINTICMVGARVRDAGGPPSEVYQKCLASAREIARASLFFPVVRQEAVQAMIILAGWQDNGWLIGGHAVRCALEMGLDKAIPRLLRKQGRASDPEQERELFTRARIWLCLYLHEQQLSFGTGRTAQIRDDQGIANARALLAHPLAIPTDVRLVSTAELLQVRARVHEQLQPLDAADENVFVTLRQATADFEAWYQNWNEYLKLKHPDQDFFAQSLFVQRQYAELFHHAVALRVIRGPDDVAKMPPALREVARRAMAAAENCLDHCLRDGAYRSNLKFAVHYTHVCAAFAGSFLLRLGKLFPEKMKLSMAELMDRVESLAKLLAEMPASRYARSLRLMLAHARRRASPNPPSASNKPLANSPSSGASSLPTSAPSPSISTSLSFHSAAAPAYSPTTIPMTSMPFLGAPAPTPVGPNGIDSWASARDLLASFGLDVGATGNGADLPLWLQESTLGDLGLPSMGTEAFFLPSEMDPSAQGQADARAVPQLW